MFGKKVIRATYITSKIIFFQFHVYQYKENNICKEIHAKISYVIMCAGDLGGHFSLILCTFLNCFMSLGVLQENKGS